jgi:drug/metabolite transporter (DMT)-like permease
MARTFSYSTTAFLLGAAFFMFTSNLIQVTLQPGALGTLVLLGYGIIYGNMSYLLTRRYLRREHTFDGFSYAIGLFILFPAVFLIEVQGEVFPTLPSKLLFYATLLLGTAVGTMRGRQKGYKMREELMEKKKREQELETQRNGQPED